jgi:hypothetical protein
MPRPISASAARGSVQCVAELQCYLLSHWPATQPHQRHSGSKGKGVVQTHVATSLSFPFRIQQERLKASNNTLLLPHSPSKMRLFLLPISTRRTLVYCDRVATQVNASGKLSYHDRIVNKANATWADWENSPNKYKKKLTDYGNVIFNRISYEEWGLKTLPSSTADLTPTEIVFPGRFFVEKNLAEILRRLATERQGLHKQRFWGSLIGLPFTIPVGLLPVIPNIPGLYLAFRAWSHFKGQFRCLFKH